jgi:hypothetical protein
MSDFPDVISDRGVTPRRYRPSPNLPAAGHVTDERHTVRQLQKLDRLVPSV